MITFEEIRADRYSLREVDAAYGVRKCDNHKGGKILWQLTDAIKFHIEYFPCENCEKVEKELLRDYKKRHFGQLPIANERE